MTQRRGVFTVVVWTLGVLAVASLKADAVRPPSGTWLTAGQMSLARAGAAAALLRDGRLLVVGGETAIDGGAVAVATAELFDGAGFSPVAPLGVARTHGPAVALKDGRVLAAGGFDAAGQATASVEIYDPTAGTWSPAGPLGEPRAGHVAIVLRDGRVLVAGGEADGLPLASVELFDPANGAFTPLGTMTAARKDFAAALLHDGRVLIVGGSDVAGPLRTTELFDPEAADPATAVGAGPLLSSPRAEASATTLLDGSVLIAGGSDGGGDVASADVFDPLAETISPLPLPMNAARSGHRAFLLPGNNAVLIVGSGNASVARTAELYVPWRSAFEATGSLADPRDGAVGAALPTRGVLAVAGGSGVASAEIFGFPTLETNRSDYRPGETVTISGGGWQPGETVTLVLHELSLFHSDRVLTAVADPAGGFVNADFAPEDHDLGVRFYLTATGGSSGRTAQWSFTDDQVVNDVDATIDATPESRTIVSGGSTSVGFFVQPSNTIPAGDANGCNATGASPATVTLNVPAAVTMLPASLTFTGCGVTQNVTFSSSLVGSYSISVASVTGGKAGSLWNTSPAAFTLTVTPPPDTTPPVITPNVTGTLGTNGWYTSNVTVSWTVTDPESAITSQSGCTTTTITGDTTGTELTCTAASAGGSASQSVTIKRDATPPTGVTGGATRPPDVNGWYNRPLTVTFTGSDATSGIASCTSTAYSGPDGTGLTVSGTCTDNAGNTSAHVASAAFKYDATPPLVTITTPAANGSYVLNAAVPASYGCTDATAGVATCAGPVPSGSNVATGTVGPKSFTVNASDQAGNTATLTNSYGVFYAVGTACLGAPSHQILQPVDADGSSVFQQKSTVPAKFRVCDANGVSIGSAGVVSSFRLVQIIAGTIVGTVDEAVVSTTPDSVFRWDLVAQQWIFNMATKGLQANTTYVFQIGLNDGTPIVFQFGLK